MQFVTHFIEDHGGPKHGGGMYVVPACVHFAVVLRPKRDVVFFMNGECIHVGSQRDTWSFTALPYRRQYSRFCESRLKGNIEFRKRFLYELARLDFLILQFRMSVNRPPQIDDLDPTSIPPVHRRIFVEEVEGLIASDGEVSDEERESLEIFKQLIG